MADYRHSLPYLTTIASGSSTSRVLDIRSHVLFAIYTPSALTAAKFKFQSCPTSDGTFQDVYDETGTLVTVPVSASQVVQLPTAVCGLQFLKIVSLDSAGVAVNEAAARDIWILGKS